MIQGQREGFRISEICPQIAVLFHALLFSAFPSPSLTFPTLPPSPSLCLSAPLLFTLGVDSGGLVPVFCSVILNLRYFYMEFSDLLHGCINKVESIGNMLGWERRENEGGQLLFRAGGGDMCNRKPEFLHRVFPLRVQRCSFSATFIVQHPYWTSGMHQTLGHVACVHRVAVQWWAAQMPAMSSCSL